MLRAKSSRRRHTNEDLVQLEGHLSSRREQASCSEGGRQEVPRAFFEEILGVALPGVEKAPVFTPYMFGAT